ncbi:MAG: hypothetical protein AMXMBFR59_22110 [Rhodanobacteraceae bacterium]
MLRHWIPFLLAAAAAGGAAAAPTEPSPADHAAHAAHHAHEAPASPATPAAPAQRWATDAPLREGMGRVRAALDALSHDAHGHLSPAQARERAVQVEDAISYLFANCALAPDADAALHGILAPLLAAAQRLNRDPSDTAAVAAMRGAVMPYPLQFDDPGWVATPSVGAQ